MGEANDWFNKQSELQSGLPNVPGQLIRNTFGATAGGPIVKDKGFLFPGLRYADFTVLSANPYQVPSDALRTLSVLMTVVAGRVTFDAVINHQPR